MSLERNKYWTVYKLGLNFLRSKWNWILTEQKNFDVTLMHVKGVKGTERKVVESLPIDELPKS